MRRDVMMREEVIGVMRSEKKNVMRGKMGKGDGREMIKWLMGLGCTELLKNEG